MDVVSRAPCLAHQLGRVEANCQMMSARAKMHVRIRPHVKTHKCIECRLQVRDHFGGITVSTMAKPEPLQPTVSLTYSGCACHLTGCWKGSHSA